jgi:hypothetical protein
MGQVPLSPIPPDDSEADTPAAGAKPASLALRCPSLRPPGLAPMSLAGATTPAPSAAPAAAAPAASGGGFLDKIGNIYGAGGGGDGLINLGLALMSPGDRSANLMRAAYMNQQGQQTALANQQLLQKNQSSAAAAQLLAQKLNIPLDQAMGLVSTGAANGILSNQFAQKSPQLVDVAVEGGGTQKQWVMPGQSAGTAVGAPKESDDKTKWGVIGEDNMGNKIYGFPPAKGTPATGALPGQPGAAPQTGDVSQLHGDEFVQTLDPQIQSQVKAIVEGRAPYPTGMLLKTPYGQRLAQYVTQADPTFETGNATARVQARKEFLTGGPNSPAGVITAGNTALQHLGDLSDAAEKLGNANTSIPGNNIFNAAKNSLMSGQNAIPLAQFNNTVAKYVDEATKFYRGAGGTEADIQRDIKNLSPNMSPAELRAAIAQSAELMRGKVNALQDRWHKAMGPSVPDISIVQPESQNALDRIGQRAAATGQPSPQAAPSAQPPQASTPPVPGAKLAPDGKFYLPDPRRPGKYLMVQ